MAITSEKINVSFRLSRTAKQQVETLTQQMGLSQTAVVETAIRRLAKAESSEDRRFLTATELMKRPMAERKAALRTAAILAAPYYNEDLAKPPAERELTAFTALDGVPFLDYLTEGADDDAA